MRKATLAITATSLLSVFLLGSIVGWAVAQSTGQSSENDRPISEMRKDMKVFIKRSKSDDDIKTYAAIVDLCVLHRQIVSDSRYEDNPSLVNLRAQVANRLKKCQQDMEISQRRATRAAQKLAKKSNDKRADALFLAAELEQNDDYELAGELSQQLHVAGQLIGGPSQVFSYANGNFGPGNAQDLIQLIETTIDPDSWRTNGGNGRMFFYQPACALVVSASMQTQERMTDLLRQMRRLNR